MKRLMVDIEAWDRKETAIILSIGLVNIDTGEGRLWTPAQIEQEQHGRTIGADTARWWSMQSEAAREAVFGNHPVQPPGAVAIDFLNAIGDADELWASGTSYDMKILSHFCGYYAPDIEWPFWIERDHRTMRALFDREGTMKPERGTEHDALEDAKFQAEYLKRIIDHVALAFVG